MENFKTNHSFKHETKANFKKLINAISFPSIKKSLFLKSIVFLTLIYFLFSAVKSLRLIFQSRNKQKRKFLSIIIILTLKNENLIWNLWIKNENKSDIKRNEKKFQIQIKADKRTCNKFIFVWVYLFCAVDKVLAELVKLTSMRLS